MAFGARDAESPTVYGGSHGLLSPRGGLTFDVRGSLPPGAPAGHSVANAHLIVLLSNIPWGRFGTPADVAQMTLFLASSAADYVTGEVFAVNGGAFAGRMYLPLDTATAR